MTTLLAYLLWVLAFSYTNSGLVVEMACYTLGEISLGYNLTHQGQVMHIYTSKLGHHWLDNLLASNTHQAIILSNAGLLLTAPLETYFSEISIRMKQHCPWNNNVLGRYLSYSYSSHTQFQLPLLISFSECDMNLDQEYYTRNYITQGSLS